MIAKTVDIHSAQVDLPGLVALVAAGTDVILTKDNAPVARIVAAVEPPASRVAGLHRGAIRASDDFDEPLPEQFWKGAP